LKRPDFTSRELSPEIESIASPEIWDLVETEIKYEGYAARQQEQNRKLGDRAAERIPDRLDFSKIAGLSSETRQKLAKVKPISLGQAARISGVTPADISILAIWLSKNALRNKSANFTSQMRC
jgi:tRNA uridine 5-carboxymethylaminomethyl modification enzyme